MLRAPAPLDALSAPEGVSRVIDLVPNFFLYLALSFVFFVVIYIATPYLLRALVGRSYSDMTLRDRRFFASSVSALPHHAYVVNAAAYSLNSLVQTGFYDAAYMASVAPLTLAYFTVDLVAYAIPERDVAFLVHHILGIAITAVMCSLPVPLLRWVPHLLITEVSTPLLLLGRALRKGGLAGSFLCRVNDLLVMATFFICRVVNMPFALGALLFLHPEDALQIGFVGVALTALLCMLQFYWFFFKLMPAGLFGLSKKTRSSSSSSMEEKSTKPHTA